MNNPERVPATLADAVASAKAVVLPDIFGPKTLGAALEMSPAAAVRLARREGVPFAMVGRRPMFRRDAVLDWLRARETAAAPPPPVPKAPAWAVALLKRGRRPGLSAAEARKGGGR